MTMDTILGGLIFFSLGSVAAGVGVSALRKWIGVRGNELVTIADATIGGGGDTVAVEGIVQAVDGDVLESPLEEESCVAYEYLIERYSGDSWYMINEGEDRLPFVLDDGTATAYVDPEGARTSFSSELVEGIDRHELPDGVGGVKNIAGMRRYLEGRIEVGDTVYVKGRATTPAPQADVEFVVKSCDGLFISNDTRKRTQWKLLLKSITLIPFGMLFCLIGLFVVAIGLA